MVFGSSLKPLSVLIRIIHTIRLYARIQTWKIAELAQKLSSELIITDSGEAAIFSMSRRYPTQRHRGHKEKTLTPSKPQRAAEAIPP